MEQKKHIPYLEDGQAAKRFSEWQRRLSESSEAVLSVLSDSVKAVSVENERTAWEGLRTSILQERNALLSLLTSANDSLPRPKGIFVTEDERAQAYRTVCRFLGALEARVQKIRTQSLSIAQMLARLATRKRDAVRAEAVLWEVSRAAETDTCPTVRQTVTALQEELAHTRAQNTELLATLTDAEQALRSLCSATLPDFCTRTYALADMEHDGAACNPLAVLRLCGELRAVLEALTL